VEPAEIDRIADAVVAAGGRGEPLGPAALTLLLRRYMATGRDDLREAIEQGLTRALEGTVSGPDAASWLETLSEASAISDDERLRVAIGEIAAALRGAWPGRGSLAAALESVGACLCAATTMADPAAATHLIAAAVDELERVIGRVYRPGEALPRSLERPDDSDGALGDHVEAASALLTAYAATGRLPYAMLADELMQFARRHLSSDASNACLARAEAARVMCRLAALHDDEDYRAAAVVAPGCDYRADARRVLEALTPLCRGHDADAAVYAVAVDELLDA
jgi:uncharacterized protein YyaL (SSP411 family)